MKTVYTVHGQDDGTIGIFSSWKKATDAAIWYCGPNAKEDTTVYSPADDNDRAWDVRFFDGDQSSATITRWWVR